MGDAPNMSAVAAVKQRILEEMIAPIGKTESDIGGGWKVLIMDSETTKIMSSFVKMSDLVDCQVSVVEDLNKKREPLYFHAIYFITPTMESVKKLTDDFKSVKEAVYPAVHVFFSSRAQGAVIEAIKKTTVLASRLRTLKEANLEFLAVDSHTFITNTERAMVTLMGDKADTEKERPTVDSMIETIVTRISTFFATMQEYPTVRYRQKPPETADVPGADARGILCQRVATRISDRLTSMQRSSQLPARETCDLLVLDRSFDPIAPVVHEWTYEALAYDLLPLDDNIFVYEAETNAGTKETRQEPLSETDELWCQLRHMHISEALTTISGLSGNINKNKQALTLLEKVSKAAPEQRAKDSRTYMHFSMVHNSLPPIYTRRRLLEVSEVEQDLVIGKQNSKDLITFLMSPANAGLENEDKMRLFLCYLATHPGRMDAATREQWMKVARLSVDDMNAVTNIAYLNVVINKQAASKTVFGGSAKPPKNCRPEKNPPGQFKVGNIEPLLVGVVDEWAKGKLLDAQYPYVRAPMDGDPATSGTAGVKAASARQNKGGWPNKNKDAASATQVASGRGRRLIIFIVGGATRSEMRTVHEASKALNRDVLLISTNIWTPTTFLDKLRQISTVPPTARA